MEEGLVCENMLGCSWPKKGLAIVLKGQNGIF